MTTTVQRREPSGPVAGVTAGLPLSLVARFAASFAAVAADWPDQPPDGGPERSSVRVAVTPTHDVWLIRWPAGSRVRPHDHGTSVGAFAVVRGELEEFRWDAGGTPRSRRLAAGETGAVDRGVVHDVHGVSADALSVHVYSPPLSTMAIYDDDVDAVIDVEVVADDAPVACDPAGWRALVAATGRGVSGVDRLIENARQRIAPRATADQLDSEVARGTLVVDIRPVELRERDGELPGAVVVGRNVLEWRLDPQGDHRIAEATDADRRVLLVCDEGYASSLAAATLLDLGRTDVTDLDGGFQAWRAYAAPAADGAHAAPAAPV